MRALNGVIRSWRVHPICRSQAMRAPVEIIEVIVPKDAMPTM
jgi:hypothetical protein